MNFYNGYIRCLSDWGGRGYFTPGKVYHVKDGKFLDDHGVCTPTFQRLETFNDWTAMALGNWEELELVKCDSYECGDVVVLTSMPHNHWVYSMYRMFGEICTIVYSNLDTDNFRVENFPYLLTRRDFVGKLVPKDKLIKETTKTDKDWTHNEIKKARNIVTEYMKMLASQRRTLIFETSKNPVECAMIETKFNNSDIEVLREAKATCKDDIFNEDIGMCVAACKVLNKPIPDFILNK